MSQRKPFWSYLKAVLKKVFTPENVAEFLIVAIKATVVAVVAALAKRACSPATTAAAA